jgi:hypothetical protein
MNVYQIYSIIIIYRLLIALNIATVFDPDEYWQSLESKFICCVVMGFIFEIEFSSLF